MKAIGYWATIVVLAALVMAGVYGCRRAEPGRQDGTESAPGVTPTIITEDSATQPSAVPPPSPAGTAAQSQPAPASPLPAQRAAVRWEGALDAVLQMASRDGRPVMALCCSNRIPDCGRLRAEGMNDPEVIEATQAFHCTVADLDRDAGLAERLEVTALPAIAFLTPEGSVYDTYQGYGSPALVAEALREAAETYTSSGGGAAGGASGEGE